VECGGWCAVRGCAVEQMLDVIFDGRPFQRFWFLETVARMPTSRERSSSHALDLFHLTKDLYSFFRTRCTLFPLSVSPFLKWATVTGRVFLRV